MTWRPSVLPLGFGDLSTEHAVTFGVELWFQDSRGGYWRRNIYGKLAELTDVEQKQLDHLVADRHPRLD
jgi:hypothetical protein